MVQPAETTIMMQEESVRSVKNLRKLAILKNLDVTRYCKSIFDKCDVDKDGFISRAELREFINKHEGCDLPEELVKKIHSTFDENNDEKLDFYEFLDLISHPTIIRTFRKIGSRYMRYIEVSSLRRSLALKRTVTDTGLYEEEFSVMNYTFGMVLLSIFQILCFCIDKMYADKLYINKPIEQALRFHPYRKREVWRYVTYILVHGNVVHLSGNVLFQTIVGIPLEIIHAWRVLLIYLIGAFGGCLVHSVVSSDRSLIGGSGGLYAFYTAHISTVLLNWREMSHPFVHLLIFGILTAFDAVQNFIQYGTMEKYSYAAHLGGAAFGFLLGVLILRNLKITETENRIWYGCLIVFIVSMSTFIILDIVFTNE